MKWLDQFMISYRDFSAENSCTEFLGFGSGEETSLIEIPRA